jgi:hypothetical protein
MELLGSSEFSGNLCSFQGARPRLNLRSYGRGGTCRGEKARSSRTWSTAHLTYICAKCVVVIAGRTTPPHTWRGLCCRCSMATGDVCPTTCSTRGEPHGGQFRPTEQAIQAEVGIPGKYPTEMDDERTSRNHDLSEEQFGPGGIPHRHDQPEGDDAVRPGGQHDLHAEQHAGEPDGAVDVVLSTVAEQEQAFAHEQRDALRQAEQRGHHGSELGAAH